MKNKLNKQSLKDLCTFNNQPFAVTKFLFFVLCCLIYKINIVILINRTINKSKKYGNLWFHFVLLFPITSRIGFIDFCFFHFFQYFQHFQV